MNAPVDPIALLDAEDPLRHFRDQFTIRDGLIYLDGNSLGMLPKRTVARMSETITQEWGEGLITSWLGADWVNSPRRIGDKIDQLVQQMVREQPMGDALFAQLLLGPDSLTPWPGRPATAGKLLPEVALARMPRRTLCVHCQQSNQQNVLVIDDVLQLSVRIRIKSG